jgi:hypothetical protein
MDTDETAQPEDRRTRENGRAGERGDNQMWIGVDVRKRRGLQRQGMEVTSSTGCPTLSAAANSAFVAKPKHTLVVSADSPHAQSFQHIGLAPDQSDVARCRYVS